MILKYFSNSGWIFIDKISWIEKKFLIKEEKQIVQLKFDTDTKYEIELDVTEGMSINTIFLLNDEGKTIERIN